ncbi:MAG: roadblock/LC7 domain-containing protein [Fibrobacterota bacterium]
MREDLVLRPDDIFNINCILTRILDESMSDILLLINKSGRLITHQAQNSSFDAISISALVSGTFASSNSIANLIGEDSFDVIHQAGRKKDIYIEQVDRNNILTCIFPKNSNVKKVKYSLESNREELLPHLQKMYAHVENDPFLNIDVSNYAQ